MIFFTVLGKETVESITPWLISLLIDWCNFDEIICSDPIEDKTYDSHTSMDFNASAYIFMIYHAQCIRTYYRPIYRHEFLQF